MKTCYGIAIGYRLAIADLVKDGRNTYMLTRINVPVQHRGQGYARQLLKQILDDADREGVIIKLHVSEGGGLSDEQLTEWYKRHGFAWRNCLFYERLPKEQS